MDTNIPETIKFEQAKSKPLHIAAELSLERLPRLHQSLPHGGSAVRVELRSEIDKDGKVVLNTQLHMDAGLECQRCMQAYQQGIQSQQAFVPVFAEKHMQNLPEEYEGVLLEDGKINIFKMIEDELLLSLPQIAMHVATECEVKFESVGPKPSQFDILASLKN
jgi:uncharacterized protein